MNDAQWLRAVADPAFYAGRSPGVLPGSSAAELYALIFALCAASACPGRTVQGFSDWLGAAHVSPHA
jgi:hypothetical protein